MQLMSRNFRKMSIENSAVTQIEDYSKYFRNLWIGYRPLIKLFQTDFGKYLYDPGTNKVLQCELLVYRIIEKFSTMDVDDAIKEFLLENTEEQFLKAAAKIKEAIETEKILLTRICDQHFLSQHFTELDELCRTSLGMLILETTTSCNMRCSYCVYGPLISEARQHGNRHMDLATAKKAVDYLKNNSSKKEEVFVTFYGGEPLLRLPFIQSCVNYSKKAMKGKKVRFALTTNGTLLTPEISEYLYKEDFNMNISIDGPEEIHDYYRVDNNGKGTYKKVIKGLKYLTDAYRESSKEKIQLSMVYTPPFSEKKLNRITELWHEQQWMDGINTTITYPHPGSIPPEKLSNVKELVEDKKMLEWAQEKYMDDYIKKKDSHPLIKEMIIRGLIRIFRRPIYSTPINELYLNGCCLPAVRKIFVDVDGDICLCERIHRAAPILGNINEGIDIKKLRRVYVEEYSKKSIANCSKCWANRLCGACYIDAYSNERFDISKKEKRCEVVMYSVEQCLKLYTNLLTIDPEGLNYLADIEIT